MSNQSLAPEAMALPFAERVSLAQALWRSIDAGLPDTGEHETVRHDEELSSGNAVGRTHAEIMQAVRRTTGCA